MAAALSHTTTDTDTVIIAAWVTLPAVDALETDGTHYGQGNGFGDSLRFGPVVDALQVVTAEGAHRLVPLGFTPSQHYADQPRSGTFDNLFYELATDPDIGGDVLELVSKLGLGRAAHPD